MSASNATAMHGQQTMPERDAKSAEKPPREPSMEDILASIRQIIAGDQQLPLSPRSSILPPLVRPATAPPAMFPLRATLQASLRGPIHTLPDSEPAQQTAPTADAEDFGDIEEALRPDPEPAEEEYQGGRPFAFPQPEAAALEAAAEAAPPLRFERQPQRVEPPRDIAPAKEFALAETAPSADPLVSAATGASVTSSFNALAATMMMQNLPPIEDIAREMLRPILKAWLDDNLPVLVERLVRTEIERVARGGR